MKEIQNKCFGYFFCLFYYKVMPYTINDFSKVNFKCNNKILTLINDNHFFKEEFYNYQIMKLL